MQRRNEAKDVGFEKNLMNTVNHSKSFRLRSFVRRDSRITSAQKEALATLWSIFGLSQDLFVGQQVFGRIAPCFLEIGFGSGSSLLTLAKNHPDKNFIGIETHKPGIGKLLLGLQAEQLTNLRIYHGDAIDIFENCLPLACLDGIQIFFPDPWQKRRHHPRRLIQSEFVHLMLQKCKPNASLHLATDWQDYALHMMNVLSSEKNLLNNAGENQFANRSCYRPIITKFEQRAQKENRQVWELQFIKVA